MVPSKNTQHHRHTVHKNETVLLSKGLKYNLHSKLNNWTRTTAIETETTISYVKETKQKCVRQAIAKTVKHFLRKNTQTSTIEKQG
jgi:hypothetical protein